MKTLTARQAEIAGLVAKGLSRKAIAARTRISEETVKVHIREAANRIGGDASPMRRIALWFYHLEPGDAA